MVRVTNGLTRHARHRKFVKLAKGFRLGRKNVYKQVRLALIKQGQHEYRNRKEKKREFRKLWIERISAACRTRGMKYSTFVNDLYNSRILLNRKVLSNVAILFPQVFDKVVEATK
jgi:large subunit ribosomal protein L20